MLDNIVHFSGCQGSGKSTLVREIAKHENFLEHIRTHSVTLQDTYMRAVWRLTKYYIEAKEQIDLANLNPDKVILGNRCVYDNFAYMHAFRELGWVSKEQSRQHEGIFQALFSENIKPNIRPQKIVYIAPPFDWVKERLNERWQKEDKKWREDNFDYLSAVINEYDILYDNLAYMSNSGKHPKLDILKLEETDYHKRIDIVLDWLKDKK